MRDSPLSATLAVARRHGLPTADPRVLRDLTNVLVHLAPAPVVARVPLTLARLRGADWFATELEVAGFLARAGAPVAPPADEVEPGPHEHEGRLVTFWRLVEHDTSRFDATAAGHSLRSLHHALARYPGALPRYDRLDEVRTLLEALEPSEVASAEQLAVLRDLQARLARRSVEQGRPLHGDVHFGNVLWTRDGPLWGDLENLCSGPVEYDLACLVWRADRGTDEALAAYGPHDPETLALVEPFLALFLAAWTIVVVERMPSVGGLAEARRRIRRALGSA